MNNEHFDAGKTPSSEAMPAELRALYQRLEGDGALWRAQTQAHVDEIENALKLEADDLANRGGVAEARRTQRSLTDVEATDALSQAPPEPIHEEYSMPIRRRTGILSGLAVVVVVVLVALTFYNFVGGRMSGPPASATASANSTPTVGVWETLSKLTLKRLAGGATAGAIAPTNTDVVYQPLNQQESNDSYILGLRRSDNGGRTWHNLSLPVDARNLNYLTVLVSPLDAHVVFLQVANQAASSCGAGDSATARVNGNILASGTASCMQEYFSASGGETWASVQQSVPGILSGVGFDVPLLIGQGSRIYGTTRCYGSPCIRLVTSVDGGRSWQAIDGSLAQQGLTVCNAAAPSTGTSVFAITSPGDCSRIDQHARTLWRSDDAGAHWARVSTLPTTNEHGIAAVSRGNGQEPLLYAVLPTTISYRNDKTGDPQPIISEGPADLKVSEDGGKTWQSAPTAGVPSSLVMVYSAFGALSDGSIIVPFASKGYEDLAVPATLTLYRWQPGAKAWTRLTQVPNLGDAQFVLVTPQSPNSTDGKDNVWVIMDGPQTTAAGNSTYYTVRYRVG